MVSIKRITGWDSVLNMARLTSGKGFLNKEPTDDFKKRMLVSEHSPIRKLLFEVTWNTIPYWVAMHLRTHSLGFKSSEDDLYFVQTQRTDRTQKDRNTLQQDAPVIMSVQMNAQSIINVSKVRLCKKASKETKKAWMDFLDKLKEIEPILFNLCQPSCVYRGFCPEYPSCGFSGGDKFNDTINLYRSLRR